MQNAALRRAAILATPAGGAALIFLVVLAGAFLGILSRPLGFLATIWPANALMLDLLVKVPSAARPAGWLAGFAAFMLADLVTGSALDRALALNGANLVGIGAAWLVLSRLPEPVRQLREPMAPLWIALAAAAGGLGAGIVGGLANPVFFGGSVFEGLSFWWVTEVVNYIAVLPVMMAAPAALLHPSRWRLPRGRFNPRLPVPALAVLVTSLIALFIGGPGAIALPVLALFWSAMVYSLFTTTLLALAFSMLGLYSITGAAVAGDGATTDPALLFSLRLGVSAVALMPLTLSILNRSRNEMMATLRQMALRDALTGASSRAHFVHLAERSLSRPGRPAACLLMLDLDHFKAVNDGHGHAAGDQVLGETVRRIVTSLRPSDRVGRIGGEEFAVLLPDCQLSEGQAVAERVRAAIAAHPFEIDDGALLQVTASIGIAVSPVDGSGDFDSLMRAADRALYDAKNAGRNRVALAGGADKGRTGA